MKCSKCGAELSEDTKFCSYCGNKVGDTMPPPIQDKSKESDSIPNSNPNNSNQNKTSYPRIQRERISKTPARDTSDNGTAIKTLKSNKKIIAISVVVIVLLLCVICVLMKGSSNKSIPFSAAECIGKEYTDIEDRFRTLGFENITIEKLCDLQITETDKVNTIESVIIDGNADFTQNLKFDISSEVVIRCHTLEKYDVRILVDFMSNLIFNKYNVKLLLDDEEIETLKHGEGADLTLAVEPGEHTITFRSAESSSVKGIVDLTVDCDIEVAYKISCSGDEVTVETMYTDRKIELSDGETKINVSASEYKHKNYQEVSEELKLLGFTNIEHEVLYDIVFGITSEGDVESVSIAGNKEFTIGDIFPKDASVVITYHMKESSNPNRVYESKSSSSEASSSSDAASSRSETPASSEAETSPADTSASSGAEKSDSVSYSTNGKDTVKNGNTGIYSYYSNVGSYEIYWIIDFDEGYVYYFTEGNESGTCDKVKIDSGDLNEYVTITYHDGGSTWQEFLHFKWKNQPDILIVQGPDGYDTQYRTTNLEKAIALRDSKSIIEY